MSKTNTRLIHTGLFTDTAASILHAVLGQESDGIWENSRGHEKYWCFANIQRADNDEVLIEVSDGYDPMYRVESYFHGKNDYEVREYFANRIKQIAKIEMKDDNCNAVSGWNRSSTMELCYLHDGSVSEAYLAYEVLKGRSRASSKYRNDTIEKVIGHPMTPEMKAKRDAVAKIKAEAAQKIKELEAKHAAEIAELQKATELEVMKVGA